MQVSPYPMFHIFNQFMSIISEKINVEFLEPLFIPSTLLTQMHNNVYHECLVKWKDRATTSVHSNTIILCCRTNIFCEVFCVDVGGGVPSYMAHNSGWHNFE